MTKRTLRRVIRIVSVVAIIAVGVYQTQFKQQDPGGLVAGDSSTQNLPALPPAPAADALKTLEIKGRAAKTGYSRSQFGNGWADIGGCDARNRTLARDLTAVTYVPTTEPVVCKVQSGTLNDPYTGKTIQFMRGESTSDDVQIDHVVALSDAWQKGAQGLTPEQRVAFANDPLELLAVDGPTNSNKGDGDAATWLPPNKSYRCQYVARQIAVKQKYRLWVTRSEYDAMARVLQACPGQTLPI